MKRQYKILIVDDEPTIAEGICFMIERGMSRCNVVGVAHDGTEGVGKTLALNPDIVMTDIRMIHMDGIEMIEKLQERGYEGRFLILSGYTDFEYAKNAIRLGVDDYLTKPIEEEELYEVLGNICLKLDNVNKKKMKMETLENTVEDYEQNIKEYMLKEMFHFSSTHINDWAIKLRELGFPVTKKQYVCVVYQWNINEKRESVQFFWELAETQMNHYLNIGSEGILVQYSETEAVIVLVGEKELEYGKLIARSGAMRLELEERTGMAISVGVGLIHHSMEGLKKSFEEAMVALNYKVIQGNHRVIAYGKIRDIPGNIKTVPIDDGDLKQLEECVDKMDDAGCAIIVEKIFQRAITNENLSPIQLQILSLNIILLGIRKMPFMQFQLNEFLGKNILSLESIAQFETIEQLKNWIINILKSMNELMLKQGMPQKRDVIEEAKAYLIKNFNHEITLVDIADRFFINPYYFSQLFKKRTGDTYQNFLTGLRIERAKKLLEETDLKIYEVCEMVGYTDTKHFAKVFERHTGVKPSEYRKKI